MATVYLADDLKHERKVVLRALKSVRLSARMCLTAMAVVVGCATAACGILDACGEVRNVEAMIEPDFTATGLVRGVLFLTDGRSGSDDQFSWFVSFAPTNSADSLVTEVHLHQVGTDNVLYTFPVSVEPRVDPNYFDWQVSTFETSRYQGSQSSVPFDQLYGLVSSNGTYVDVHTVAHPAGAKGRLVVGQSTNWTEYCD